MLTMHFPPDSHSPPSPNPPCISLPSVRRMIRQVDDVIATADARHALIMCHDGGVIYYNRAVDSDVSGDCLVELSSTQRNPDSEIQIGGRGWALRRVGQEGEVLLLRTLQTNPVTVVVAPLSDESDEVKPTAMSSSDQQASWSEWGAFSDPTIPVQEIDDYLLVPTDRPVALPLVTPAHPKPLLGTAAKNHAKAVTSGRPPLVPGTASGAEKTVKRQRKAAPSVQHRVTPMSIMSQQGEATSSSGYVASSSNKLSAPTQLQPASTARVKISEDESAQRHRPHQQHQQQHQQLVHEHDEDDSMFVEEPEAPPVKRRALVLVQPPKVRRIVEVPLKLFGTAATAPRPTLKSVIFERFKSLCNSWIEGGKRGLGKTDAVLASRGFQPLGVNTLRHLGSVCVEQDRLKSQFIGEVARCMGRHLQRVTEDLSAERVPSLSAASAELESINLRYQGAAKEMVTKSQVELVGFVAMDTLLGAAAERCDLRLIFRHGDMFESARGFLRTSEMIVATACKQHH